MPTYVILIRGINVGGKNKIPMTSLRTCLEELGCSKVATYIASGNVILESDQRPDALQAQIERALPNGFAQDGGAYAGTVPIRNPVPRAA